MNMYILMNVITFIMPMKTFIIHLFNQIMRFIFILNSQAKLLIECSVQNLKYAIINELRRFKFPYEIKIIILIKGAKV